MVEERNERQSNSAKTLALLGQFSHRPVDVDVVAGFEAGMKSMRMRAPAHLSGPRWAAWHEGHKAAVRYRDTCFTYFIGETPDGRQVKVVRKGWVARGPVVSQMERQGVTGDVYVTYVDGSRDSKARTVKCCI